MFSIVSITTINIPKSVNSIKNWAFSDCPELNNIYFEGDKPELKIVPVYRHYVFDNDTATVYSPRNNPTWNDIESNRDGGGNMTFVPYDP